ncbi:MAG: DHHW family protein [Sarcina sp.]
MNTNYYKKLTCSFIFLLFTISLLNFLLPDKVFSETENRVLQNKPKFTIDRLLDGRYFKKYDKYKSDQFLGRNSLIEFKSTTDLYIGKRESNNVYFSSDNYLIEEFSSLPIKDINKNIDAINYFAIKHPTSKIYTSIIPTSELILESKLPYTIKSTIQKDYIDYFYKNLNAAITPIDAFEILSPLKDEYIYYKTDHHYTSRAAFEIYNILKTKMKLSSNITFTPYTISDSFNGTLSSKSGFNSNITDDIDIYLPDNADTKIVVNFLENQKKSSSLYNLDRLKTKDKYAVFLDGNHSILDISTNSKSDKSLLIIKDSYANSLIPFLIHDYKKIIIIDPRYYYGDFNLLMSENKFDDVLIYYNANTFFSDDYLYSVLNNE